MFRWIFTSLMAPANGDGGNGGNGGDGNGNGGSGNGDGSGDDGDAGKTILDTAGAGGDGDAGAAGDGDGKPGEWSWGEDVPGSGSVPPWLKTDKYKTVADQAKAAIELETKLGPAAEMLGAPEGDYEMPKLPEGVEGTWDAEDAMLKTFQETAKKKDISQALFNDIVQPFAQLLASEKAAEELAVSDALAELGTNSAARIEQVRDYMVASVGEDLYSELNDAIGTNVKAYQALEAVVAKASGDAQLSSLPGKTGPGFTKADIEAERYKAYPEGHKLAGKSMYEHDAEHRTKVQAMWKELFPGEDITTVG